MTASTSLLPVATLVITFEVVSSEHHEPSHILDRVIEHIRQQVIALFPVNELASKEAVLAIQQVSQPELPMQHILFEARHETSHSRSQPFLDDCILLP